MIAREPEKISRDLVSQARSLFLEQVSDPVVIQHVQEMHHLLSVWQARTAVLTAAWLLVLVKNELVQEQQLTTLFGNRAVNLARLASKIIFFDANPEHIKRTSAKATYAEISRRLFIYAYADYEGVLIVVADQLATTAQVNQMPDPVSQEWAGRNQAVFLPLLEMLGLWKQRGELGNISLSLLNPVYYQQLQQQVQQHHFQHQRLFDSISPTLEALLHQSGLAHTKIALHLTTPASLYAKVEKLKRRGESPKFTDVSALCVDVLVEHELDCYVALGVIHNQWKPALRHLAANLHDPSSDNHSRFYDNIAAPRYNGYRCLITSVLCETPANEDSGGTRTQLVEFRLRTYQMDDVNTYGIAAAMLHPTPIPNAWWTDQAIRDLIKPGNTDLLNSMTEIAVFTPNGEVIYPVRAGSSMIDYAYKIHSNLGSYAKAFWVNGKPVSSEYEPHHRDLIEIEFDLHYPSVLPDWETIAKLSSTKTHIRRFQKLRENVPHKGRRLINDVLERESNIYRIRFPEEKVETTLAKIARDLNCASVESLYMRVSEGTLSPDEVVAAMIETELVGHIVLATGEESPTSRIRIAQTWMQEKEPRKWERSSRVLPGVEIVGKYSGKDKGRTLMVYRRDSKFAPTGDQAVPLMWRSTEDRREAVEITVSAPSRSHVIGMVFNAVYAIGKDNEQHRITIHRFHAEMQDGQLHIHMLVDAASHETLQLMQDALQVIQRSAYVSEFKIWQLFPGHKNLIASRSNKRQQNPYTLKQVGNRSMFYGRQEEINKIIQNIDEGHLVVLYGQKRIGKTSLLNQLAENLMPLRSDFFPVMFDVHWLTPFDTSSFLFGLIEATLAKLDTHLKRPEERKGLKFRRRDLTPEPFKAFAEWVSLVQQRLQGTRLVFMVDEFTRAEEECRSGSIEPNFFDGLQWLAGERNISFVLCVHDHIMAREGNKSWGLLQRGKPIRLDALDRTSAERLVQQPLENHYKLEPDLVQRVLTLTNCHPYLIHVICHTLITHMSQMDYDYVTSNDLDRAVREVLIHGDHYFSHLRSRTSDHDWDILKIIAYMTDAERPWVTSDEIREAMARYGYDTERKLILKSIGDLRQAGIIEGKHAANQAMYSIPIGLFHSWLRQIATHLIVSRDLQLDNQKENA